MFTVLLVEDEPAAQRYLGSIFERSFTEFSVIGTAGDGAEALRMVERFSPELVVTDVKMPGMDGLELVERLKVVATDTPVIIVSGYDDFDYVRQALNTGVVDYVLKPVTARRLAEVLKRLRPILSSNADYRALSVLRAILHGGAANESALHLAVLRRGGPLSRFPGQEEAAIEERYDKAFCILAGRDHRETIFAAFAARLLRDDFEERCREIFASAAASYRTLVFAPAAVPAVKAAVELDRLYLDLDRRIVLGRSRVLDRPSVPESPAGSAGIEQIDAGRIQHEVVNASRDGLKRIITGLAEAWEREGVPALVLQTLVRSVLEEVRRASLHGIDATEIDLAVEELIGCSQGFDDFTEFLCALADRIAGIDSGEGERGSAGGLFFDVRVFVESSFTKRLTVEVVSERFHISPSYLSRLFRSETGMSFNEYLRRYRIEAAKTLMRKSPGMPLKNVARYVGFSDPFYFSRVFRAVTGVAPSAFLDRDRESRG